MQTNLSTIAYYISKKTRLHGIGINEMLFALSARFSILWLSIQAMSLPGQWLMVVAD